MFEKKQETYFITSAKESQGRKKLYYPSENTNKQFQSFLLRESKPNKFEDLNKQQQINALNEQSYNLKSFLKNFQYYDSPTNREIRPQRIVAFQDNNSNKSKFFS